MNNTEREDWINNDENLYQFWKSTGLSMRRFIKIWRNAIDFRIRSIVGRS